MPYRSNFKLGNPKAESLIRELSEMAGTPECGDLFREILMTVTAMGIHHRDVGDFKLIHKALKELRQSFAIFAPYRSVRKAAIFGSSRVAETHPNYILTQELAQRLVEVGFMIISGAGGGIMEAANRGAGKGNSFGVNINLPFEQEANPYIEGDPKLIVFKYFFTRKLLFIKESHATVLLPGGFGTLDEGFENLMLFQTGKCMPRPIVLLEEPNGDYWEQWLGFAESSWVPNGFISREDLNLFQTARSAEEAAGHILQFYRVYHSLRYVKDLTVLRLTGEPSPTLLKRLNGEFSDIVVKGRIEASGPLPDELKAGELLELPRIVFHFDKHHFGRLNEMIHTVNRVGC